MDWNSDGQMDMVSGDRNGFFNVFIRDSAVMHAYYQYKLMDSTVLDIGGNSQPAVVDWDGDNKKDLLLGTENYYINFYKNLTSDTWPMFQTFEQVQAAGSPIYLYRVNPYVFDLDGDLVQDLICGANDGYVRFYRNTGTNQAPVLAAEEFLMLENGTPIQPPGSYPYGSRCGFGDWDNDGNPDFLLSGYDGTIWLYRGIEMSGTAEGRQPDLRDWSVRSVLAGPGMPAKLTVPQLGPETRLEISDAAGRPVASLGTTGSTVTWDGAGCAAGVYYCRAAGRTLARITLAR